MPVLSFDVSSDNNLLVSGSSDKYIRVWGMDFGDCHRAILAHNGAVTQVKFVKETHYIISAGRDAVIRYWDGDTKELIHEINCHKGDIWALAISSIGDFIISGGSDKILRCCRQTKEQVFIQIESSDRSEKQMVEKYLSETGDKEESQALGKRSWESLKNGEEIIEAILEAEEMKEKYIEYEEEMEQWRRGGKTQKEPKKPDMTRLMKARSIPE